MFERFESRFDVDHEVPRWDAWDDSELRKATGYSQLMARFAGCSFDNGLYRLHSSSSGPLGQELAVAAFPEFAQRIRVFGFDWLGRQASLDFNRVVDREPQVLLLEPGTGEALEIPANFQTFHDEELIEFRNEALASDFFAQWRATQGERFQVKFAECVGYQVPLFLGGQDVVGNLELIDFEVYWDFCGQLRRQTHQIPVDTVITEVSGDE